MVIHADEKTCSNIDEALEMEWLETDGLGGYASSTLLNCHTRRYHGLLIPNLAEPSGRHILLSKFEDSIYVKGREYFLSCHRYPGVFFPDRRFLTSFEIGYSPHWTYRIGEAIIHVRIMLVFGEKRVLIRYSCEQCDDPLRLRLRPFLAFRSHHDLAKKNLSVHGKTYNAMKGFKIQPYDGMPPIFIQTSRKPEFFPSPIWYRNFEYDRERERGFDFHEDLFQPGVLDMVLKKGYDVVVSASTEEYRGSLMVKWDAEMGRRIRENAKDRESLKDFVDDSGCEAAESLVRTCRHFLVRKPSGRPAVIAGYHWFSDWGRDTLLSLPGLAFCRGRMKEGMAVLKSIAGYEKRGLLPNFFSEDEGTIAYNSVDSALWFFWTVQQMIRYGGNLGVVEQELWPVMKRIIRGHLSGTEYQIRVNGDGLLHAGDETMQLTWMDVSIGGKPVTPRSGCAVDVNALWYNAICFADELSARFCDDLHLTDLIPIVRDSFNRAFWMEEERYLADVLTEKGLDRSMRPNQILAMSLPYALLSLERGRAVVEKVKAELMTPYGLRTLSPGDLHYIGRYVGDPASRDRAYHQGTVWPWLVGHFGEACIRVAQSKAEAKGFLLKNFEPLFGKHLCEAGLGFVSEIFDGDPPHRPNGCIAQAWSSAEVVRLLTLLKD